MAFSFSKSTPNNFPTTMSCSQMMFFFPTSNLKSKEIHESHTSHQGSLSLSPLMRARTGFLPANSGISAALG
jgi:hypothetical protein